MEVLYLIPGDGMPEDEIKRREDVTNSLARDGTNVKVKEVDEGPLSIESEIEAYMSIGPMLKWPFELRKDNKFDAIIIGCVGNPGFSAARELMNVPIIGPAEVAYHMACMVADRFSVISPKQAEDLTVTELPTHVRGFENPTEAVENVIRWLVKNGYSDEEIAKIAGKNALQMLEKVW